LPAFQKHYQRVVQIASKKQDDEHIQTISESVVKEVFKDLPEGAIFDEAALARLAKIGAAKMAKFLVHKQNAVVSHKEKRDK